MKIGKHQHAFKKKGQKIYKFRTRNHTYHLTVIEEFYHYAGNQFWKEAVKGGESSEGFSINEGIYNTISLDKLLIFEKSSSNFYKLENRNKALSLKGITYRKGVKLHVLPLTAYKSVRIEDKTNIITSPVDLSKADLQTRQVKLRVKT